MKARIDLMRVNPGVIQAMLGLERQVRKAGLDRKLLDLVRMRASQINGCAYCLDMHSKDARANGETEQRLYGLNAWRETPPRVREVSLRRLGWSSWLLSSSCSANCNCGWVGSGWIGRSPCRLSPLST